MGEDRYGTRRFGDWGGRIEIMIMISHDDKEIGGQRVFGEGKFFGLVTDNDFAGIIPA